MRYQILPVLIAFILALLTIYIFMLSSQHRQRERDLTRDAYRELTKIKLALEQYKKEHGIYPATHQGLAALYIKPKREPIPKKWHRYLSFAPVDPWGKIYQYHLNGNLRTYQVYSLGPDGVYQNRIKPK